MKKTAVIMLLISSLISYGDMPKEIEDRIYINISELYKSYGERQTELDLHKSAYKRIEKLENENSISKEEFQQLKKKLEINYPDNYVMQYKKMKEEIEVYQLAKNNLKKQTAQENLKAKEYLNKIDGNKMMPASIMQEIKGTAAKKYPDDYLEQKKYIENSLEIYEIIAKKIKK